MFTVVNEQVDRRFVNLHFDSVKGRDWLMSDAKKQIRGWILLCGIFTRFYIGRIGMRAE